MKSLVIQYMRLRQLIGFVAMALPFALLGGQLIFGGPSPGSLSGYYYTGMRDWFVGSLCAIGVFLIVYRGYSEDVVAMRLMAAGAIGAALFPTGPAPAGILHGISAVLLFLTMTYVCAFLFPKTNQVQMTLRKEQRNGIYAVCGALMLASLTLVPVLVMWAKVDGAMFILETAALESFGVAWVVKGQAILKDETGA